MDRLTFPFVIRHDMLRYDPGTGELDMVYAWVMDARPAVYVPPQGSIPEAWVCGPTEATLWITRNLLTAGSGWRRLDGRLIPPLDTVAYTDNRYRQLVHKKPRDGGGWRPVSADVFIFNGQLVKTSDAQFTPVIPDDALRCTVDSLLCPELVHRVTALKNSIIQTIKMNIPSFASASKGRRARRDVKERLTKVVCTTAPMEIEPVVSPEPVVEPHLDAGVPDSMDYLTRKKSARRSKPSPPTWEGEAPDLSVSDTMSQLPPKLPTTGLLQAGPLCIDLGRLGKLPQVTNTLVQGKSMMHVVGRATTPVELLPVESRLAPPIKFKVLPDDPDGVDIASDEVWQRLSRLGIGRYQEHEIMVQWKQLLKRRASYQEKYDFAMSLHPGNIQCTNKKAMSRTVRAWLAYPWVHSGILDHVAIYQQALAESDCQGDRPDSDPGFRALRNQLYETHHRKARHNDFQLPLMEITHFKRVGTGTRFKFWCVFDVGGSMVTSWIPWSLLNHIKPYRDMLIQKYQWHMQIERYYNFEDQYGNDLGDPDNCVDVMTDSDELAAYNYNRAVEKREQLFCSKKFEVKRMSPSKARQKEAKQREKERHRLQQKKTKKKSKKR